MSVKKTIRAQSVRSKKNRDRIEYEIHISLSLIFPICKEFIEFLRFLPSYYENPKSLIPLPLSCTIYSRDHISATHYLSGDLYIQSIVYRIESN